MCNYRQQHSCGKSHCHGKRKKKEQVEDPDYIEEVELDEDQDEEDNKEPVKKKRTIQC